MQCTFQDRQRSETVISRVRGSGKSLMHQADADNVLSAWAYGKNSGQDTIFVSFDFHTIVSHAEEIFKLIGLHCVDPLYAVHYF